MFLPGVHDLESIFNPEDLDFKLENEFPIELNTPTSPKSPMSKNVEISKEKLVKITKKKGYIK